MLVFFSGKTGSEFVRRENTTGYLRTWTGPQVWRFPSPDGMSVAYVSFGPFHPPSTRRKNPGGIPRCGSSQWLSETGAHQLTAEDPDTTTGLRWLGNDALVFDRIGPNIIKDMHRANLEVSVAERVPQTLH